MRLLRPSSSPLLILDVHHSGDPSEQLAEHVGEVDQRLKAAVAGGLLPRAQVRLGGLTVELVSGVEAQHQPVGIGGPQRLGEQLVEPVALLGRRSVAGRRSHR